MCNNDIHVPRSRVRTHIIDNHCPDADGNKMFNPIQTTFHQHYLAPQRYPEIACNSLSILTSRVQPNRPQDSNVSVHHRYPPNSCSVLFCSPPLQSKSDGHHTTSAPDTKQRQEKHKTDPIHTYSHPVRVYPNPTINTSSIFPQTTRATSSSKHLPTYLPISSFLLNPIYSARFLPQANTYVDMYRDERKT